MTTLAGLAGIVAGYRQLELDVFGLLWRWASQAREPEVKILLSVHGRIHGEHAAVWEALLPALAPDPVPPIGLLACVADLDSSAERLAGFYRSLLPALIHDYRRRAAELPAVSAAPVIRMLRRMADDDGEQVAEGERLLGAVVKEELGARPSNQSGTG